MKCDIEVARYDALVSLPPHIWRDPPRKLEPVSFVDASCIVPAMPLALETYDRIGVEVDRSGTWVRYDFQAPCVHPTSRA